jgi:hypothetical protein
MAYGFDKSVSLGRFFPDGEFHGFQEYLNERFQEMLAKGQTEQKFFNEFRWALVDAMHSGTDFMAGDLLPRLYTLAKPYKSLGDLINLSAGIAVSSRLRDHHIWRGFVSAESGIAGFDFYVSDTMKAAIDAAGLKMPPFYRLKKV